MARKALWAAKKALPARRSVVVSGLGIISPLGNTARESFENLLSGKCGIQPPGHPLGNQGEFSKFPLGLLKDRIDKIDRSPLSTSPREARHTKIALEATREALRDAGLDSCFEDQTGKCTPNFTLDKSRVAVNVGLGIPCLQDIFECGALVSQGAHNKISPFFVPKILGNTISGQIAVRYGLQGGSHCVTSACTTGTHCIGEAFRMIERGDCDVVIAGAAESCVHGIATTGFHRLRALSTTACRPFDVSRDGFVIGEGGAILVLEEAGHAMRRLESMNRQESSSAESGIVQRIGENRNFPWHCEIIGYGVSSDGYHITAPHPDGTGCTLCMERALNDAGVQMCDIDAVFAHATGTPRGDEIELAAVAKHRKASLCAGNNERPSSPVPVVSFKGAIGHLLGAAGSVETALSILSVSSRTLSGTLGLENPVELPQDIVHLPKSAMQLSQPICGDRYIALKNSFGFGGTNASLVFCV